MPARSVRVGPAKPKMTLNTATAAAANATNAAVRTMPGLTGRNAACNRPLRRSMATGTAILATWSNSSTRSAIALASTMRRKTSSMVPTAIP